MVVRTPPVGMVNLASPVGMVNLAPPVGVVNLASPAGMVNLAPVGVVILDPSCCGGSGFTSLCTESSPTSFVWWFGPHQLVCLIWIWPRQFGWRILPHKTVIFFFLVGFGDWVGVQSPFHST